jgi:uncharacterized ferritin-like protein (DUF455 family)
MIESLLDVLHRDETGEVTIGVDEWKFLDPMPL